MQKATAVDNATQPKPRFDLKKIIEDVMNHEVPAHVTWIYCFGGITLFLFLIQACTGIVLYLYYKPIPAEAYPSLQNFVFKFPFGWLVRSLHRWAANGMVFMVIIHMLRVFLTGSYKTPRQLNWVVGMVLLLLTFGFAITGFLLPWDQQAYWVTNEFVQVVQALPLVGGMLAGLLAGGPSVGAATLARFFSFHVYVLPAIIALFLGAHFVIIRKQGISGPL